MDDKLSIEQKSLLVDLISNEMARLVYKRSILRYVTGASSVFVKDDVENRIELLNGILNII